MRHVDPVPVAWSESKNWKEGVLIGQTAITSIGFDLVWVKGRKEILSFFLRSIMARVPYLGLDCNHRCYIVNILFMTLVSAIPLCVQIDFIFLKCYGVIYMLGVIKLGESPIICDLDFRHAQIRTNRGRTDRL